MVDQSDWGQIVVRGTDRVRFVQGLVTNDVAVVAQGGWCRAAVLSVKGRVLAVVNVVAEADALVVLTEAVTAEKVSAHLERHAIADDVVFERGARPLHRLWHSVGDVWSAPPLFAPPPRTSSPQELAAIEVLRIEAGLPRYGVDVDEDRFPFEAGLDREISFTKGCYAGQEVVARAHSRGQANWRLVGLRLDGTEPAAPGAILSSPARADAGRVTSSGVSPRLGPIALAYVHRSSWEPGTTVSIAGRTAVVVTLPMGA